MTFLLLRRALLLLCIALGPVLQCQVQPYQVFFVVVGSGWYAPAKGQQVHGFPRIPGANASAELVAGQLLAGGAEFGVEVKSDEQAFVTVADIEQAIARVKSDILASKASNPLFVFYIASHGISEGIAWNHFSLPGDFVYRGDPDNLDIEGLSNSTLYAGSLVDELEKLHIPFVVMLDSCSDGQEKHFEPAVLSEKATRNLNEVGTALRVMNEFRNSYPVLFSTTPGKSVTTVANPFAPDSAVNIAPLARRFALAVGSSIKRGETLALATFLERMVSPQLDSLTTPAVTHSPVPSGANAPFLLLSAKPHTVETVAGTGREMRICCAPARSADTSSVKSRLLAGSLSITGAKGEYISSGGSLVMASPGYKVSVTQQNKGDLEIRFEREDTEFDANFSTGSDSGFEVREYKDAQRWNMADPGHPAIEISGDGRGCGEIAGSFTVSNVEYGADGQISRFAATFTQLCDDSKIPARGRVELGAE
jgi:hypothetical protein